MRLLDFGNDFLEALVHFHPTPTTRAQADWVASRRSRAEILLNLLLTTRRTRFLRRLRTVVDPLKLLKLVVAGITKIFVIRHGDI